MNDEQMTIFEVLNEIASKEKKPLCKVGDILYVCILDQIRKYKVEKIFDCRLYYGYSLIYLESEWKSYNTVWCNMFGKSVFLSYEEALAHTKTLSLNKISKEELNPYEVSIYNECREVDGRTLYAVIGKVSDTMIYFKNFSLYPFLTSYRNTQDRDREFRKILKSLGKAKLEMDEPIEKHFDDMYLVDDNKWSSVDYASRHGEKVRKEL